MVALHPRIDRPPELPRLRHAPGVSVMMCHPRDPTNNKQSAMYTPQHVCARLLSPHRPSRPSGSPCVPATFFSRPRSLPTHSGVSPTSPLSPSHDPRHETRVSFAHHGSMHGLFDKGLVFFCVQCILLETKTRRQFATHDAHCQLAG